MRAPAPTAWLTRSLIRLMSGRGYRRGNQRGVGRFSRKHRCDSGAVTYGKKRSACSVSVVGPGIKIPEIMSEGRALTVTGQAVPKQWQVVGQPGIHQGNPNSPRIAPIRPGRLQGLSPAQRLEIAVQVVEIFPPAVRLADRPTRANCAIPVGNRLNQWLGGPPLVYAA